MTLKFVFLLYCIFLLYSCGLDNGRSPQSELDDLLEAKEVPSNCRENILLNTCIPSGRFIMPYSGNDIVNDFKNHMEQPCANNSLEYAFKIDEIFESLPEHTRTGLCHIRKIFIVPGETPFRGASLESLDYEKATILDETGDLIVPKNGFVLWLSKKFRFDQNISATEYQNKLFQQFFRENFEMGQSPTYIYQNDQPRSSLYNTLVHEVGHFLDFAHEAAGIISYHFDGSTSTTKWDQLSWRLRGETYFPQVNSILYNPPYAVQDWKAVVNALKNSPFVSLYSLQSPQEDFAEIYRAMMIKGVQQLATYDLKPLLIEKFQLETNAIQKRTLMDEYIQSGFDSLYESEKVFSPDRVKSPPRVLINFCQI
jgi:hypothetical protein